jgi:DNA polymerase III epsilon subunit-like protein
MSTKPLDYAAGPLVWVDCEMTGLDPRKDKILEIAVRVLIALGISSGALTALVCEGYHHERAPRAC